MTNRAYSSSPRGVPLPIALLRIDLPAELGWREVGWSSFDAAGQYVAHGNAAPDALPAHEQLEIVVPARRVSAHPLSLPRQEKRHLEALVAQAMEDRLLGDKADALCVLGPLVGSERRIWVCSRAWLDAQLLPLAACGLYTERIFPEYELLPLDAEVVTCVETVDGAIFRGPDGRVGLVDTIATVALLTGRQDMRLLPERRRLTSPRSCTPLLAASPLRPAHFDPRRLRRSALLLSISAALLLLGNVLHWRSLENQEAGLRHEIRQTFATTFPGTTIIDPLLQWESKVRELAPLAGGDALDAVLMLAGRLNIPLHPTRIEARDGLLRITLSDSDAARFKLQLDGAGPPESSPAEPGFTRLQFRFGH